MKVAVLMGGTSDEREVSLASGVQVAGALREAGHDVVAVDTVTGVLAPEREQDLRDRGVGALPPSSEELAWMDERGTVALTRSPELEDVDVFFLALHGGSGEDGTMQALLDVAGVTYTGSDRLGCSLAMDKEVTKRLLRDAGVPTPKWYAVQLGDEPPSVSDVECLLGLPVIVKASGGGSSLRLELAHDRTELEAVIAESRGWNDVVLYERYHRGRELTVGVVDDRALPVGEIVPRNEIFDYECKYQPGMAEEIFPADIPETWSVHLQELSLRVHRALRLRDYSRIDFIVDPEGGAWCLEANTLPGMTGNSLLPKAARAAGLSFPELCSTLVEIAARRDRRASRQEPGSEPGVR
ncbi:MAG: D-alanine--D-alanine ligase [Gemmatimonadota bacterium]